MKLFIRALLISVVPGISFSPLLYNWLNIQYAGDTENNEGKSLTIQITLFIVGTLSIVFFNYHSQYKQNRLRKRLKNRDKLTGFALKALLDDFTNNVGIPNGAINIRIFKVKKSNISDTRTAENFHIDHITQGIIADANEPLIFTVNAETTEGVVGKSLKEGTFFVDFYTGHNNSYVITEEQRNKIGKVKFCCAVPVFKTLRLPLRKDKKIKYIVSLDSENSIKDTEENQNHLSFTASKVCKIFDGFVV